MARLAFVLTAPIPLAYAAMGNIALTAVWSIPAIVWALAAYGEWRGA